MIFAVFESTLGFFCQNSNRDTTRGVVRTTRTHFQNRKELRRRMPATITPCSTGFDFHVPAARMRQRMEIAVIHERFQFHLRAALPRTSSVMNVSRVFALAIQTRFSRSASASA